MTIPDFQTIMLPLTRLAADDHEHRLRDAIEQLAQHFGLSDEERRTLLPSGRQATFDNRVSWASTHLRKAGLLQKISTGRFRITQRGHAVLNQQPSRIDMRLLEQFPEFRAFRERQTLPQQQSIPLHEVTNLQDPEEMLDTGYQQIRQTLVQDLIERVKSSTPQFFERLVVQLLVAMEYGGSLADAHTVGRSGDGGIDGIIKEDKLGLDAIYVQAKKWQGTVGRPDVQAFTGSLEGERSSKGVFITTSTFSQEARDYVRRIQKKIVLIDGEQLAQLMMDHNVGVSPVETYVVKRIDSDYFEEA